MTSLLSYLILLLTSLNFFVSCYNIDIIDLKVGCDKVVNSGLEFDRCGICGGKEETCKVFEGVFRQNNLILGYNFITRLPTGAKRINITELSDSTSYLALNSSNPGGGSYVNGKWGVLDKPETILLPGTHVKYKRPRDTGEGESMIIPGPITEDMDVWLIYQRENPGIFYEYTMDIPEDERPQPDSKNNQIYHNREQETLDQSLDVQGHSDLDGRGIPDKQTPRVLQSPVPVIPRKSRRRRPYVHGSHAHALYPLQRAGNRRFKQLNVPTNPRRDINMVSVPHKAMTSSESPQRENVGLSGRSHEENNDVDSTEDLETQTSFFWAGKGYGPCTKSCAEGRQIVLFKCLQRKTNKIAPDKYCAGLARPPVLVRKCNRQACPAYYNIGRWSECSRTCGVGTRSRRVSCNQQYSRNYTVSVPPKRCRKLPKPAIHQQCAVQQCPSWKIRSEWSKCNVECGTGKQNREVLCTSGEGMALPRTQCARTMPPPSVQPCRLDPCVTGWFYTDWGQCSTDCDAGAQNRDVTCVNSAKTPRGCQAELKPEDTRRCTGPSCGEKYDWFAGTWGPCSVECGGGMQDRKVVCMIISSDGVMKVSENNDLCNAEDKPTIQQTCNTQRCGSRWYFTGWKECTATCGGGTRHRDVLCLDSRGKYSSLCKAKEKPITNERCNTADCSTFIDPTCVDKLSDCRMFFQAGLCGYNRYREKCCHTCSGTRG